MTVNVYRVFKKNSTLPVNIGHLFSVVASESKASYAIPKGDDIYEFAGFTQSRVDALLNPDEAKPDTPEKWSELALLYLTNFDTFLIDDEYETFEEAMEQESLEAKQAWHLRNSETIS